MKVLLDTHTFLWAASEPKKLSRKVRDFITGDHQPLLSAASLWEISLKVRKGKLEMVDAVETLTASIDGLKLTVLPVRAMHALKTISLPDHHSDPFDRMIVAQAILEGAAIATLDPLIHRYAVDIFW